MTLAVPPMMPTQRRTERMMPITMNTLPTTIRAMPAVYMLYR